MSGLLSGAETTVLSWTQRARVEPSVLWNHVTDFSRMHEWFLGVRRVTLATPPAEGAMRTLTLLTGHSHRERIASWDPGRSFAIEVLDPPPIARDWRGDIALEPSAEGTLLRWELRYTPRFGPVGRLVDRLFVRPVLGLAFRTSLRRLAARAEHARG